ncbi:putative ABC exporter domain-containing protein [Penaeicola halotolerans]|uniref:putative ABC exporter domain-containing protein n=1 Tax=Penaeicola halotolerans TaxID=2793196 RepID=UPI001CF8E95E|nr:putative ABC exporter domain-containing protein [Penaeicola halotolerans]
MSEFLLLLVKDLIIIKNNIKLILRNPARLLPYIGVVGYFSYFYFKRAADREVVAMDGYAFDDSTFKIVLGILTLLLLAFFIFNLYRALNSSITFFSLADVNMLFTAPTSPKKILTYYIVRSIFPSLGAGILFVVYSSSSLMQSFKLGFLDIAFLILAVGLFGFIASPIKFLFYALVTKRGIGTILKVTVWSLIVMIAGLVFVPALLAENFWEGAFSVIGSEAFNYFPIVGWCRGIGLFFIHQNIYEAALYFGLMLATFFIILYAILANADDYYEDVLESTSSKEDAKELAKGTKKAGDGTGSLNAKKLVQLKNFGTGAKALYWRNYVHSMRIDFHPFFGLYAGGTIAIMLVLALLARFDVMSHKSIYVYLAILSGIYFMAGLGRVNIGDFSKPYFILLPDTWFRKVWNSVKLDVYQTLFTMGIALVLGVFIAELDLTLLFSGMMLILALYVIGLAINLAIKSWFSESLDQRFIKPIFVICVILFGMIPAFGLGLMVFLFSKVAAYGYLVMSLGMSVVAAIVGQLALDVIKRFELKD